MFLFLSTQHVFFPAFIEIAFLVVKQWTNLSKMCTYGCKLFMFFLMFLSRLINQKSIEMKRNRDRRRFLRMKIRQRAKRLRLCKFAR